MFSDPYIDKEENNKILDVLISFLTSDEISLNVIDAEDPEVICYSDTRNLHGVYMLLHYESPNEAI